MKKSEAQDQELLTEFFDKQQSTNQYESLKRMTQALDRAAAEYLNREVHGDVLTVGGVWDHFEWRPHLTSLSVLDMSAEMLRAYCPEGATGVIGDLYVHDFAPASFDAVVFPLMLHHTPQGNWRSCEQRIEEAVQRARRWLKPGGRLFIVEFCPHPAWYPVQRALLPFTRRFLKHFEQPLVVMYTRGFYERVLTAAFGSCESTRVSPPGFDYSVWYPIFMGVRWLKMPFALYPKMHLFSATVR